MVPVSPKRRSLAVRRAAAPAATTWEERRNKATGRKSKDKRLFRKSTNKGTPPNAFWLRRVFVVLNKYPNKLRNGFTQCCFSAMVVRPEIF
jgi:hypothetical protein